MAAVEQPCEVHAHSAFCTFPCAAYIAVHAALQVWLCVPVQKPRCFAAPPGACAAQDGGAGCGPQGEVRKRRAAYYLRKHEVAVCVRKRQGEGGYTCRAVLS